MYGGRVPVTHGLFVGFRLDHSQANYCPLSCTICETSQKEGVKHNPTPDNSDAVAIRVLEMPEVQAKCRGWLALVRDSMAEVNAGRESLLSNYAACECFRARGVFAFHCGAKDMFSASPVRRAGRNSRLKLSLQSNGAEKV